MNRQLTRNEKNIRKRTTAQGMASTCWFHAALNGFLITSNGRHILQSTINNFRNRLTNHGLRGSLNNFTNRNLNRLTSINTRAKNELRIWKILNILLNKERYTGAVLRRTATCSGNVVRLFIQSKRGIRNLNRSMGSPAREFLYNFIAETSLKNETVLYNRNNNIVEGGNIEPNNVLMIVSEHFNAIARGGRQEDRIPREFHNFPLDHAAIVIHGGLTSGRTNLPVGHANHSILGVIYNGTPYIVDSAGPGGIPFVQQCDWVSNLWNILALDFYSRNPNQPYYHPNVVRSVQIEYLVFIKPNITDSVVNRVQEAAPMNVNRPNRAPAPMNVNRSNRAPVPTNVNRPRNNSTNRSGLRSARLKVSQTKPSPRRIGSPPQRKTPKKENTEILEAFMPKNLRNARRRAALTKGRAATTAIRAVGRFKKPLKKRANESAKKSIFGRLFKRRTSNRSPSPPPQGRRRIN